MYREERLRSNPPLAEVARVTCWTVGFEDEIFVAGIPTWPALFGGAGAGPSGRLPAEDIPQQ